MRRILYIFVVAVIIAIIFSSAVYAANSNAIVYARLFINNQEITTELDTPPIIRNDRTLVPARAVFERMGGSVYWNDEARQVTVAFNGDKLVMTIDHVSALLNDSYIEMEVPPIIFNERTLIPLRFPAEVFGFCVSWDCDERVAFVNSRNNHVIYTYYHTKIYGGEPDLPPYGDSYDDYEYYTEIYDDEYSSPQDEYKNNDYYYDCTKVCDTESESPEYEYDNEPHSDKITYESHPVTTIINFSGPNELGLGRYAIEASSPITDINYFLLYDNRLVVDIYNSISDISAPFPAFEPVREVRSSQFSTTPNVTRVVFELTELVEFDIVLSANRQTIIIAFSPNVISEVAVSSTVDSDTLLIHSDFSPSLRICSSGFPRYMTIYIDNAEMDAVSDYITGGAFAYRFVTGQLSENLNIAYVRVYFRDKWPVISMSRDDDSSAMIVFQPPPAGVRYDFSNRELILCRDMVTINDISRIRHLDEYLLNRYTLTIPSSVHGLGLGAFSVGDGFIDSIELRRDASGNTMIVFDTARVMTFRVHQTPTEYIIRAHLPQEVYQFIVVIDPGHGGRDPGAVHNGIREADLVLTISHMVMEHLNQNPNIRAYMTRHTNAAMPNRDRAAFANQMADLYVSIHANAVADRPTVSGIETWYMNHSREDDLGFSSRQLATIMQNRLINATGANNRGLRTNPNFIVLRDTNMPSVLLEVGFLTNAAEAARLATAQHQRLLARAIYQGIVEAFSVYQPPR